MTVVIERAIDVLWQITCLLASIGVCAVVALLAICVLRAVWQIIMNG